MYSGSSLPTFGEKLSPILNGQEIQEQTRIREEKEKEYGPLKIGPVGCPETSVRNYHYTLRNIAEERRSQLC